MKIVFINPFFWPVIGGVENHIYYLAKELIKKGHEVEVFTSNSSRVGKINKKGDVIDGIKIKRFNMWFKFSFSGMFFPGLYKAIKNSDADIFHTHGYRHTHSYVYPFTKKPCFMTPHWPIYTGLRPFWQDFVANLFDKLFGRRMFSNFERICVISGLEIPWVESFGVNKKKITLIPNGIPDKYFKKAKGSIFRKKYKIKSKETMVLCLGRLHKSKGFDQVVNVAHKFKNVKFVIAGKDGGFKKEIKKLIQKNNLKNIILVGEVSEKEKMQAFAAADIFVHPSHYEGFGIVVLEAFAQNTAILTSNKGGLPWVVSDAGLIFKDGDLQDLKEKLGKLISDKKLRGKLAKKGLKRVQNFKWKKIAFKLEKAYRAVLQKNV